MAIRDIVLDPNEGLRRKCREVDTFDERLGKLLDDMKQTMIKADGCGLAAPQVGINRRAVIVGYEDFFIEMMNPVITVSKGSQISPEACLSCKGKSCYVERPTYIEVSYQDRNGKKCRLVARDFIAKACCHEIDHLDGILFYDKKCDKPTE